MYKKQPIKSHFELNYFKNNSINVKSISQKNDFFDTLTFLHYSLINQAKIVRKIQTQILSIVTVMLIGLTMFSMANATTPEENSTAGVAFLAENAKKANIVTTASGLQYEVLTKGTGTVSPAATDTVTVHYKGTTLDGTEFDSSYSRGAPASFPLNRVIAGWTEGVQLMKVGDKFRFYIPADLAYGSEGAGRLIGPNATLIFEVELIKI
jgi:FKBP-type peptidyl-prolyl cis-trans isomerase